MYFHLPSAFEKPTTGKHYKRLKLVVASCLLLISWGKAQKATLIIPATHAANSVVISPDDKWLVSAGAEGIKIWDNTTASLLKNIAPGGNDNGRFNNGSITMCMDRQSKLLALQIADSVFVFDFQKFDISSKIRLGGRANAMVFSADGSTIFAAGVFANDDSIVTIQKLNVASGKSELVKKISISTLATHEITRLSISPNENELLVYDAVMGSWLIDLNNNSLKKQFLVGYYPYTYLPNGNLLAFAGKKDKNFFVQEIDHKTFTAVKQSKPFFKDTYGVSAQEYVLVFPSAASKLMLLYQNEYVVFNMADFSVTAKRILPILKSYGMTDKRNIGFSPNGNYYLRAQNMTKNATSDNKVMATYGTFPLDSYVQFVFKHKDGVCLKDRILSFDNGVFNQRLVPPVVNNEYSGFLYRVTADGKTGFLWNNNDGLFRFDPTKAKIEYEPVVKINNLHKEFVGMQIFDDLHLFAMIGDDGIYVMDLTTLKLLYIVDIPYGLHYSYYERLNKYCDISPDNSKMILFAEAKDDESNYIYCVDLADRNEKWKFKSENIRNLRFINGGKKLMFTSGNHLINLDAETGKESAAAITLPKSDQETIISQSGTYAATQIPVNENYNAGFNIGLVDVNKQQFSGTIKGTGDEVSGFVFLRSDRYMLTEEYGGICLWDVEKKRKIGKIYLFENSEDWVLVTDDGRFDAAPAALKKMYYTRGKEIIPLESLYEKYYTPGLLKQIWSVESAAVLPDINKIALPPLVKIAVDAGDGKPVIGSSDTIVKLNTAQVTIKVTAEATEDAINEIRLYQNGKLVNTTRNLVVENDNQGDMVLNRSFAVTLGEGLNRFKTIALNKQRTESLPAEVSIEYVAAKPVASTIDLYLLVVGVNEYKNPKYSLNYAGADATAFSEAVLAGTQHLFSKVNTTFLKDNEATKAGIVTAFEKIKAAAKPQDLFIFYYAGHGVINDKKEFFLVPYDVVQLYGNDDALAQKGLSAGVLQQMSKDIVAQKQLFILDACQSAGALETIANARGAAEEKAIAQLARSTGTQWLTASGSEQFASEFSQLGHGSFTWCLLQALGGDANHGSDKLTVKELDAYLQTKVPEITEKYKGTPQYPASYSYGNDFPIVIINQQKK